MATYTNQTLSKLLASLHLVSNIGYDTANFPCFALPCSIWEQIILVRNKY